MKIAAFVEQTKGNGYRAFSTSPVDVTANGDTREQAIERFRATLHERMALLDVVEVEMPAKTEVNPWLAIAGTWANCPEIDEFEQCVKEYRQQVDQDENR